MAACRALLRAIGEDPERDGLRDTPRRFAAAWREFIAYDPGRVSTAFNEQLSVNQVVAVTGMQVWSMCEHHLLPFCCSVSAAYIARGEVLGLSKFARVAHAAAHRLQLQERLTEQIADEVERLTGSPDVAVLVAGEHTCMSMRGIKTPATMTTSVLRGAFRESAIARDEFFRLVK